MPTVITIIKHWTGVKNYKYKKMEGKKIFSLQLSKDIIKYWKTQWNSVKKLATKNKFYKNKSVR